MNEDLISHVIQSDLLIPHLEVQIIARLGFFQCVFFGCSQSTEITPTSRPAFFSKMKGL